MQKRTTFLSILLTLFFSVSVKGQERFENWDDNSVRLFMEEAKQRELKFKGQKNSLIKWKTTNPIEWMDLSLWKKQSLLKDKYPDWKTKLKERSLREKVGFVMDCFGDCRLYRGVGFAKVQYKSTVYEGDDIVTLGDSYIWIFMLDGTLIRLAPNSSITFKELNIGIKSNFLHARLNSGNILWLNRHEHLLKPNNTKETDTLFLPLSMFDANPKHQKTQIDEDNLFALIGEQNITTGKYKRLNKWIKENNDWTNKKPTYSFLVMPNGTMFGKDFDMEFIVLLGNESYFKQRKYSQTKYVTEEKEQDVEFFYRGFENRGTLKPILGQWYKVGEKGRVAEEIKGEKFTIGEYITRNIPSIFLAREMMLRKYSPVLFKKNITGQELAIKSGYRLWGEMDPEKKDDLYLRVNFLKEYTRRIETTNLLVAGQFKRKMKKDNVTLDSMTYDRSFYSRAIQNYFIYKDRVRFFSTDNEILNSTLNPFWKKINGIRY